MSRTIRERLRYRLRVIVSTIVGTTLLAQVAAALISAPSRDK